MKRGNLIVGQSGGPTAVINSSLVGVYKAALEAGYGKIYGMLHGVEGLLKGEYLDLTHCFGSELEIELLKRTPSSYLGSCRYKLPDAKEGGEVFEKLFRLFKELQIEAFVYIGGNDSMDTIAKLSEYAAAAGSGVRFVGVPKTIDNDLAVTDHTPGFGSAAKCIGTLFKELILDSHVYGGRIVTVVEIMGRNAGWLTAASALSRMEDCRGPDAIYVPELQFDPEAFLDTVAKLQDERKSVVIAVSEGLKLRDGRYVCQLMGGADYRDAFGHKQLSGTARYLADTAAIKLKCKTRSIEFSTLQRCASHLVSRTDITEAYQAGGRAVKAAADGRTAEMIVIDRVSDDPYVVSFRPCPVSGIANVEKKLPPEFLSDDRKGVTREFLTYCRPLIQAELTPVMVDGLPRHLVRTT